MRSYRTWGFPDASNGPRWDLLDANQTRCFDLFDETREILHGRNEAAVFPDNPPLMCSPTRVSKHHGAGNLKYLTECVTKSQMKLEYALINKECLFSVLYTQTTM